MKKKNSSANVRVFVQFRTDKIQIIWPELTTVYVHKTIFKKLKKIIKH